MPPLHTAHMQAESHIITCLLYIIRRVVVPVLASVVASRYQRDTFPQVLALNVQQTSGPQGLQGKLGVRTMHQVRYIRVEVARHIRLVRVNREGGLWHLHQRLSHEDQLLVGQGPQIGAHVDE